jgi:hypothetical protein
MLAKTHFFRTMFTLLALPVVAGQSCSSDSGTGVDEAIFAACANSAPAQCNYLATCLPILFGAVFGDADTCIARTRLVCEGYAKWPGGSWTAEKFARCHEHIPQAACAGLEGLGTGPCANVPGSLPSGAACVDHSQCVTGFCRRQISTTMGLAACGTCQAEGCITSGCKAGEICIASSTGTQCAEMQAEGTPCSSASRCATGLSCLGGICTKSRGDGESCTTTEDCDVMQELECADRVCRKPSIVDIGAPCSVGATRCARGGICLNMSPSSTSSTCVAPLPDGSPCSAQRGGICTAPAQCVSGVCKLPAELSCQ